MVTEPTREALCVALRRRDFLCQAAEIEAATTSATECAPLEHALSFLAGYQRALDRHVRALRHTSAPHEAKALARLEMALSQRLGNLSADAHLRRTGT